MNIILVGWNENGEKCLSELVKNKINIKTVIVPEKYDTEGMYKLAKKNKLNIIESNGNIALKNEILKSFPDLVILASYPKLIPKDIIDIPKYGTINVHASLLPKYRGYHPINWAIIKDEKNIGVTVHYVDEGIDSGEILAQDYIHVMNSDTVNSIRRKATTLGSKLLIQVVKRIAKKQSKISGVKQNDQFATHAPRRYPSDGKINWKSNSRDIFNLIRSLTSPHPNAYAVDPDSQKITFAKSYISRTPGRVLAKINGYYLIATGDGVILIKSSQPLNIGDILQ